MLNIGTYLVGTGTSRNSVRAVEILIIFLFLKSYATDHRTPTVVRYSCKFAFGPPVFVNVPYGLFKYFKPTR
jgi:hypothetical protein